MTLASGGSPGNSAAVRDETVCTDPLRSDIEGLIDLLGIGAWLL